MFANARTVDPSTPRATVRGLKLGLTILALVLVVGGIILRAQSPLYAELPVEPGSGAVMDSRPLAPGSPAALIAAHDCWTGDAPADMVGVLPGHVVVSLPNGDPVYRGGKWVGKALEQTAYDHPELGWTPAVDHDIKPKGMCR